ncbi:MAG: sugar ABC transporter permease [Clostridia bacterium]|nr:sugar ABC transporter permease [Clostridia bacterium]
MAIGVTNQDKKKARNTTSILSVLLALFTILTVVFGVLIPSSNEKKSVGASEPIKALVEGEDGTDYFLLSDAAMYRYDAFTDELISIFPLSDVQTLLQSKGDVDKLLDGSLNQWTAKYVAGKNGEDFYLLVDGNGNIFKLLDDGVRLSMTEDYFLADASTGKLDVESYDDQNGMLYCLVLEKDSSYYIYRLNMDDLRSGVTKKKQLWDLDLEGTTATSQKIVPLTSAKTGVLAFEVTEESIYLFKNGGGVVRVGLGLTDYVDENGNEFDYLNVVKEYYEQGRDKLAEETAYYSYFRTLLLQNDKNTHSEAEIAAADGEQVIAWYKDLVSVTKFNKENKNAKDEAKLAVSETFIKENVWCEDYDSASRSLHVNKDYVDSRYYSILYAGDSNIGGIVYSEKNKAIYFTNFLDGYLYSVEKEAVDKAECGAFLSDIATKMSSVKFSSKRKFSTFGNALGINKFANTLYLRFENEQTISIVDINDKENYKVLYTFEGNFDVLTLTGDKDNKVTHVLRQVTNVDIHANTVTRLYACTYEPSTLQNKSLSVLLFVTFLIISVLLLAVAIWFFIAMKNERALYRLKIIQKDLKKNKWVYLALSFFVIMLFMFCYYEAIGAISMSFFDYTQEKPAWIWNNFANYIKILNDSTFWLSIGNMLFFLVFDLILCIVPPLIFAFLLILIRNKTASGLIRSLMFIPSIIPSMATMLIWRTGIYGDTGIMNQIIGASVPIDFLGNTSYARWALMFMGFPFVGGYLIFYGGMMNIPEEYHEAGRLEGLGIVKRFLLIDVPLIMPQIKYIFIMTFISSVQNYARTYILASTGTTTPVESMYTTMMIHGDYGKASAYATLIFLFLFAAVATNFKMQKKETMGEDL